MSTIIKCLWELAWPAQLAVCFLLLCIVGQLLCVKFGLRWWLGLRDRARGQRQKENRTGSSEQINRQQLQAFKHLYPIILKSQTLLEPCSPNLSINKSPPLLTLSIWLYILLTTQLIQPGSEQEGKLMRWLAVLGRLAMLLGWVGLGVGIGEMLGRCLWVRGIVGVEDRSGSGIQVQQQIRSQPTPNSNNSNSQQLPPSLYIYLLLAPLTTLSLLTLTLSHILTAPTFLSQSQAQQRILFVTICLSLLIVIHHILVLVAGGIGWLAVSGLGVRAGGVRVWGLAVGVGVGSVRVGVMEESKENIVIGTEKNPVDNFLFTENPDQPSTAPRPNPTTISNTKTQTTLQSRRKKQIFALPNAFTTENEDEQEHGDREDKSKRKYGSMQLGGKEPIRGEGDSGEAVVCRVGRRKRSFFTQSDPVLSQQTSVLSKLIKIIPQKQQPSPPLPPADTATLAHPLDQPQPILSDIENRLAPSKQRSSTKKRSKNDLKVINHDENADRDMQIVDLSQYVVKDLGCAELVNEYRQPVLNFNQKKLPSLKLVQQVQGVRDRDNGYYVRRKNSKPPNVSDGVQEGPVVFCVEELKKQ